MKITNFWNVAPCSLIEIYKHFGAPAASSPGYDGGSSIGTVINEHCTYKF